MLGGTGSDVGKSILAAGLCRIFRQDGFNPAPFKAQNMALNSYVTPDGLEIGRAQAVQAAAAGVECMAEMNPVLLKPTGDMKSQVVLMGKPVGDRTASEYFSKDRHAIFREVVHNAFSRLEGMFNPVVMEGAGSIAEINLSEVDIVNMPMAEYAGAKVILVADIDRGGVFASVYGSVMLQPENWRSLIKGIIINKFRGDISLFERGRRMIEEITGIPVLGVVPYFRDIHIEEEDSVSLETKSTHHCPDNKVNVAVAGLPHMSNFTDFDPILFDPRLHLYYTLDPGEISHAEVVIVPGTKNTIADLSALRESGCDNAIKEAAQRGAAVLGICGGYQIMGETIADPYGVEGEASDAPVKGLGLLPVLTVLTREKTLKRTEFRLKDDDGLHRGYEIHMGDTCSVKEGSECFAIKSDGEEEGCRVGPRVAGTYLHGCLDNASVLESLVAPFVEKRGLGPGPELSHAELVESQYDRLAQKLRESLDMELLYKIMEER